MAGITGGTVTFLMTDIEGSSRWWERAPDAMRRADERHRQIIAEAVTRHRGTLMLEKGEGDSTVSWFSVASDALAAAIALQRALYQEAWPAPIMLRVRTALHTGAPELGGERYNATTLNRCARLLDITNGGQILLTLATYLLGRDSPVDKIAYKDMGEHRLKDLTRSEHIYQLLYPGLLSDFPPLRSLNTQANNLPLQLTSFIGRSDEKRQIARLLASSRLLTLTGIGGSGKTRLALQVAAERLEDYPDGVWFVDMGLIRDSRRIPQATATSLGLREEPAHSLTETLIEYLLSRVLLLIWDNCEHQRKACRLLAERLLTECPSLRILVTSREGLGVSGEQTYSVPLFPLPPALPAGSQASGYLKAIRDYDAVCMFLDRARLCQPAFALTEQNVPWIARICRRLEGLPLAIALAATNVGAVPLEEIEARISLLRHEAQPSRHQTLQAAMNWSYRLLSRHEKRLFRRLSVFTGGWTYDAAEAVCTRDEPGSEEVFHLLAGLVHKSLILYDEAAQRYSMLDTLAVYAARKLRISGEEVDTRTRHRDYYLKLAEEIEPKLMAPNSASWHDRIELEHANIRSALEWSLHRAETGDAGLRLANALWRFWYVRGYYAEGRRWYQAMLEHPASLSADWERSLAIANAGSLAYRQRDYTAARDMLETSLTMSRELGNRRGIARALNDLANIAGDEGDIDRAQRYYEAARNEYRSAGNVMGEAITVYNLGMTYLEQGDTEVASNHLEEARRLMERTGDRESQRFLLNALGETALRRGNLGLAAKLLREGLVLCREMGDRQHALASLECLARLSVQKAQPERAVRLFGLADALRAAIKAPRHARQELDFQRSLSELRALLAENLFQSAWDSARGMSWEQALRYALEEET